MANRNESLGNYISHRQTDNGVAIVAENAAVELALYSAEVCRISITRFGDGGDSDPYAVVADPASVAHSFEAGDTVLWLKSPGFTAAIEKFPVRILIYTPTGELITRDDPAFGTSWIGSEITTYKSLQPGERFLGLGEKTGRLDRAGSACINWNFDYFGYPANADPLYTSMPFFMGVHSGLAYGIFLDSTYRSTFNFGASNNRFSSFSAAAGPMEYYFIHDESVAAIIEAFTWLVGRIPLPPLWSLGYQQCRFSYYPDREVLNVAGQFRERDIPADVIYLDIHYMDGFRVFTWDAHRFPAPAQMIGQLNEMGFHAAAIFNPGIKIESGYAPYEDGKAKDVFVKYPDGKCYAGEVWPGWCHFPDFTHPQTRAWWADWLKDFVNAGVDGFWCDMNEPSVWGQAVPKLIEFHYDGTTASYQKAHNIYGMQMARSTWEGVCRFMENRRPFVLTRSGFTGVQRYAACWTGDNTSDDSHMLADVRMVNSMGLSGAPLCGYDIGGFAGECTPDLFARWITIGVFAPFTRGHTMIDSRGAEPWAFGETVEAIARNYIKLRYRLLPYIYSLFDACAQKGLPVARSLAIDYTHDPTIYDPAFENQYLFGDALLVVPVPSAQNIAKLYLPEGRWYDFYSDRLFEGSKVMYQDAPVEKLPLFVRSGSVIPMQTPASCTAVSPDDPIQLHIYPAAEGTRIFTYYEDDGLTLDYQKGIFFRRDIQISKTGLVLEAAAGNFESRFKEMKLCFHGPGFKEQPEVLLNDHKIPLQADTLRFFEPVSPFTKNGNTPDSYGTLEVHSVTVSHSRERMSVKF